MRTNLPHSIASVSGEYDASRPLSPSGRDRSARPSVWIRSLHRAIARWYLAKPDLAELLEIKFPDAASILAAARNEWAYRRRHSRTARVISLNVETTNYCNLACTICPVNRGMARTKRYLDPGRFRDLIDRTPGLRFLLPFQWGEPLLHPEIGSMIRYAADRGIRSMMTTNGTLLDDENIDKLLKSGLDRLTISVDGDDDTHKEIRGTALAPIRERVEELRRQRDRRESPMHIDVSMVLDDATRPALEHYRREWQDAVDRVQVIPKLQTVPRTRPCRELWRGSLVVLVDGTVTACCADSEGELSLGNAFEDDPVDVLNNTKFQELRRRHRCGDFPEPCAGCGEYDGTDVGVSQRFLD